jgi:hypothetical protein
MVVLTVSIDELPPGVMEAGFRPQAGGNEVGAGDCTKQVKAMGELNPFTALAEIAYVAEPPAVTVLFAGCELREKSAAGVTVTVIALELEAL